MIRPGLCYSYKLECLEGIHTRADEYYIAFYGEDAAISPDTRQYTNAGEVFGKNYPPGGVQLHGFKTSLHNGTACLDFRNPVLYDVTMVAHGALIYNKSKSDRAVAVVRFVEPLMVSMGEAEILMPAVGPKSSLVRIS